MPDFHKSVNTHSPAGRSDKPTRVRWVIVLLLTGMSFTSYVQRMNISVASKFMMPDLGLTQIQMGQIFSSFLIGYTIFQLPAGMFGDRRGPRFVLALAAATWGVTTILTGLVPGLLLTGTAAFLTLLVVRFLLGVGEAATFPVAARAVANWTLSSERALANAVMVGGLSLGSAVTPPLVAWLMVRTGWRESFYLVAILAFVMALVWWWYGRDTPEQHPSVNAAERDRIVASRETAMPPTVARGTWWQVVKDRNVALVAASYFFHGYTFYIFVFWLYTYLTDVRGFSVIKGGWWTSLPFVVAAILTPVGGAISDRLVARVGRTWARRGVAVTGQVLSAGFMIWGALAGDPYLAIAGLAAAIGFNQFSESIFWAANIDVAGPLAGTACGILNTLGNLGGVVSTAGFPILIKYFGWTVALGTGAVCAGTAALLWLMVRCDRPLVLGTSVPAAEPHARSHPR